jgi:hypothetical protein
MGLGGVGMAHWTGVPLSVAAGEVGVHNVEVEVIFQAADYGEMTTEPDTPSQSHIVRSFSSVRPANRAK